MYIYIQFFQNPFKRSKINEHYIGVLNISAGTLNAHNKRVYLW